MDHNSNPVGKKMYGAVHYIANNVYVALYETMPQPGFNPPNETEVYYQTTAVPLSYHALKKVKKISEKTTLVYHRTRSRN